MEELTYPTLREVQRRHVENTIRHFNGDKKTAAKALGISLKTLYNHLAKYGIKVESVRSFKVKKVESDMVGDHIG